MISRKLSHINNHSTANEVIAQTIQFIKVKILYGFK